MAWFGCSSESPVPVANHSLAGSTATTSPAGTTGATGALTVSTSAASSGTGGALASTGASGTQANGAVSTTADVGSTATQSATGQGGIASNGLTSSTAASTTGLLGQGGTGTTGDVTSVGSTSTGQAAGGMSAVGGASSTGQATTGSVVDTKPSAGCANGDPSPSLNLSNTIVSLPAGYDGSTPVGVVMAFHAAGNPNTQLSDRLGDDLGDKYLMLYPKSDGSGWNDAVDGAKVNLMFSALTSSACIDENRVFAVGHSSGAQFIVQRLCAGETRWRAVAPVASSVYCNSWNPVPALVIHGMGDQERSWDPNGEDDIVPYRTSNSCSATSVDFPVDGCSSGGVQVDPGCVEFDGCSEPTIWCQHNDPQYGTSHHGIPCFADRLIPAFFDSF